MKMGRSVATRMVVVLLIFCSLAASSHAAAPRVEDFTFVQVSDIHALGAQDGKLYALDIRNGKILWSFRTGAEIISQPLVLAGNVLVTSGDGSLYCLTRKGRLVWSYAADTPIYSSPVLSDGLVLFGTNDAGLQAVDAVKGTWVWKFTDPAYTIESKPFVKDGVVYFGAWDQYVYALNVKDGSLKWKCKGRGSSIQVAGRYFSPADCGPVVSGGKLFAADRNYNLSIIDITTGELKSSLDTCAGVGLSEDGKFVYLRRNKGDLTKIDLDGNVVWSVPAGLNRITTGPTAANGAVYVSSSTGLVSAYAADSGKKLWEYRAEPYLWNYAAVEVKEGVAYVGAMDGSVTALKTGALSQ